MSADLAQTFEADAQGYDAFRPGYPSELFQAIFDYARLERGASILEIGAGTGQATQAVVSLGVSMVALEPGKRLSAKLIRKFSGFPNITVRQCKFEEFHGQPQSYDLIYSASAFHWLPKKMAYQKAFDLLKPGGTLALFWHSFSVNRADDESHRALQRVFEERNFGMTEQSHDPERYQRKHNSLTKRGFVDVKFQLFRGEHHYKPAQFLGLLSTTSRFRLLPSEEQAMLTREVQQIVVENSGVWLDQTCDLYLGKRPTKRQSA